MPDQQTLQRLLTEATAHYHSGGYRQAIEIWQEVLASDPNNQRAKEGIRMASLLLEEAQATARTAPAADEKSHGAAESPETIAKVREGIQKVREHLAASRYMEAMEVCQSLLALAPGSAAVHDMVEEAREAFEALPFVQEHLDIARQLFIQERLDEASAELHKIFFLNPSHAEARKLEGKVQALMQKRGGAAAPSTPLPSLEMETAPPAASPADTQRIQGPPDFGDSIDLPQEPLPGEGAAPAADPQAPAASGDEAVLNENWEAELAQLDLKGSAAPAAEEAPAEIAAPAEAPPEVPVEKMELMDLSENPEQPGDGPETPEAASGEQTAEPEKRSGRDLDLSGLVVEEEIEGAAPGAGAEMAAAKRPALVKRPPAASRRSRGGSIMKVALPLVGILIGGGAAWWYFGLQPSSSGDGGNPSAPPRIQGSQGAGAPGARAGRGGANLGLTSSGSRGSGGTASAGLDLPGQGAALPSAPPPPTKEEIGRQIDRHFSEGRSSMQRGKYQEAVTSYSKILELDPANLEAKAEMDEAASKVLEQKRLEEDLQTAKEFFVEKDYESALRKFYRLPRDRNLGEMDLFIRNAWYNWAVVSLKGGNCVEALQRLQEALAVDPNDPDAAKQQEVAGHYKDRPKDRVFYAYTDRLTYRTLNQK
jgi:tetratricopeptide (TPR) repeat protein